MAEASTRPAWRAVSSMAVPSGSLRYATAIPSSTRGRISRGSCITTHTVNPVSAAAPANTAPGRASDQRIPASYQPSSRCPTPSSRLSTPPLEPRLAPVAACLPVRPHAIITGIKVRARISDAPTDITTLSDRSRNSAAARPWTNTIGPNTSTVVRVPAVSGPATSAVPFRAASHRLSPASMYRFDASATTIALSIRRPTPSARPPRERMLMVTPISWSRVSATSTDSGTIRPMAIELFQSLRKNRITRSERPPPMTISWIRLESASVTNSAWAATTLIRTSGNSFTRSSIDR